jgi:uncharacterized membrane protein
MDAQVPPTGETDDQRDIRMNKDIAAFSYVWIMSVLIFITRRDSKFIQYHAKQGMILFVISILFGLIPFIGQYLVLLAVAGMLLGFINAAQGNYADVPLAGDLSKGTLKPTDIIATLKDALHKILEALKKLFKNSTGKPEDAPKPAPEPPPTVDNTPVPPVV